MSEESPRESAGIARRRPWVPQSWLVEGALGALAELNEQCLELLCEQASAAAARPRPSLIAELEPLWGALDPPARRRAARLPFLLLDGGFSRVARLASQAQRGVRDGDGLGAEGRFFTVPRTAEIARLVLAYGWHLACAESAAAQLFLGISARSAEGVAGCTLGRVIEIAEREPRLLRPRWLDRVGVWRTLLGAAVTAESASMERMRWRGLQLLAGEVLEDAMRG